jgi:hypothetical protein
MIVILSLGNARSCHRCVSRLEDNNQISQWEAMPIAKPLLFLKYVTSQQYSDLNIILASMTYLTFHLI